MSIIELKKIAKIQNGTTPSTKITKFWNGNIPFLGPGEIETGNTKRFISDSYGKYKRSGTILISTTATIGNIGILNKKSWFNQQITSIEANNKYIYDKYLFYFFLREKNTIKKMKSNGSIFTILPIKIFREWKINLLSLKEQKFIIGIIEPLENIENKLINIKNKLIKLLINLYNYSNNTNQITFNSLIKILLSKYEGQKNYFATNAVGELEIDYQKIILLSEKTPSRANVSPLKDSFIFSKLAGENKIFYFKEKPKEVFSTGFFNFKTDYHDHILGFMLSDDFKSQKEYLSTGTTMQGINNSSLALIKLNHSNLKSNVITTTLHDLENNLIKIKTLKTKLIKLLIK